MGNNVVDSSILDFIMGIRSYGYSSDLFRIKLQMYLDSLCESRVIFSYRILWGDGMDGLSIEYRIGKFSGLNKFIYSDVLVNQRNVKIDYLLDYGD
jgi:hypothetical protein